MSEVAAGGSPPIIVNGHERPLPEGGTLLDVLEQAGLAGRPLAVELDGEVVPRAAFGVCRLSGGERIEIVTFVGGGLTWNEPLQTTTRSPHPPTVRWSSGA